MTAMDDAGFIAQTRMRLSNIGEPETFLQDLVQRIRSHRPNWHWVGIYLLVDDTLHLGPFVGAPTEHVAIPVGMGVCGSAVAQETNLIVDDVTAASNYLACSLGTRSEVVVLIRDQGEVVGQFDVDSDDRAAFSRRDETFLEQLALETSAVCRSLRDRLAETRLQHAAGT